MGMRSHRVQCFYIYHVRAGSRLCEKAKMLSRDRTSYSFGVVAFPLHRSWNAAGSGKSM